MPIYTEQAAKLVAVIKNVIKEAQNNDGLTMIFGLIGALMPAASVFQYIAALPKSERDEFFGEVFDQAIGTEPGALVTSFGIFETELLEETTDVIKEVFIAYMNKQVVVVTA